VFGNEAFSNRDNYELSFPIKRGIIEDIDHMETMWEYIFDKELNLDPKNMDILLTDSPMNTKENKQQIA
jgi:actin-related protein